MARRRVASVVLAPLAAAGRIAVALLGLAVRIALFREHRTQGTVSILWGGGFALFLWAGVRVLGLAEVRAIPFATVAGAVIALFIYLRGAALENPPVEQPGVYHRRVLARWRSARATSVPYEPYTTKRRELLQARVELEHGQLHSALYSLREAERVAVAQRKLAELLDVRELVTSLAARSTGRTRNASERLARKVTEHLHAFPSDELASVGVHKPEREQLDVLFARLRAQTRDHAPTTARELSQARVALDEREFAAALHLLEEARRVAVAQRKLDELLEVYELVQVLSERSTGRTRAASARLAGKVEAALHSFA
jgi:hypothetical protein